MTKIAYLEIEGLNFKSRNMSSQTQVVYIKTVCVWRVNIFPVAGGPRAEILNQFGRKTRSKFP